MKLTWIEVKQWAALIALETSTEPNLYKLSKQCEFKRNIEKEIQDIQEWIKGLKLYVASSRE